MKRNLFLILFSLAVCSCNFEDANERFERLKSVDFTPYKNKSIYYRKGIYIYQQDNEELLYVKRCFLGNGIKRVTTFYKKEEKYLDSDEKEKMKGILSSFDKLYVTQLYVDKNDNVFLTYDIGRCTYYFLRLSPKSTLQELKRAYFKKYEDNWYFQKICSK